MARCMGDDVGAEDDRTRGSQALHRPGSTQRNPGWSGCHRPDAGAVTAKRGEADRGLEVLLKAVDDLEACLQSTRATYRECVKSVRMGTEVATALRDAGAADTRRSLADQLDELGQRRHMSRLSLTAAGIEQGMTINGVNRAWGSSRQLAPRYTKEVPGEA
jgi:hypothetical protein